MIYLKILVNHRMSTPLIPKQSKDMPVVSTAHVGFSWIFHHFERTLGHFPLEIPDSWATPTAPGECLSQVAGVLHGTWGGESVGGWSIWSQSFIWTLAMAVVDHFDLKIETVTNIGSNEYAEEYFGDCVEGLSLKQDVNRSQNGPLGSHHWNIPWQHLAVKLETSESE